jgi:opacity protein-like surface antigen
MARLLAILAVAVPVLAGADIAGPARPGGSGAYLAPRVGAYLPQHDDMDEFGNGVGAELAIGKRFAPRFAAELGIGWFGAETPTLSGFDPSVGSFATRIELSAVPITATGRFLVPLRGLDLFALAGVGVYFIELDVTAWTGLARASESTSDTAFGAHLGAGASIPLGRRVSLDLLARYTVGSMDVDLVDARARFDGLLLSGGLAFGF